MVLLRYNCKCIFVDIDPKTLNIDVDDLKKKLPKKTKVILPVHLTGLSCDMDRIDKIANLYSKKTKIKFTWFMTPPEQLGGIIKIEKLAQEVIVRYLAFIQQN